MSDKPLDHIKSQLNGNAERPSPPIHLWHPELSGDIDIVIRPDGSWWHEGDIIQRKKLVQLFASILRREDDGEYYLVTPVEKWRIRVELLPLVVVDIERDAGGLEALLNTERRVRVDPMHPLHTLDKPANALALVLENGLSALVSRSAWYRLAEWAEEREGVAGVASGDQFFPLAPPAE